MGSGDLNFPLWHLASVADRGKFEKVGISQLGYDPASGLELAERGKRLHRRQPVKILERRSFASSSLALAGFRI
jgi:hypothetical protein